MRQTQNFGNSDSNPLPVQQSMISLPNSYPARQFGDYICFLNNFPNHEVCLRGLCQLSLECFKELYGLVQEILELPEISN